MGDITIKGNKDGLNVYVTSNNYEYIKNELIKKIQNGKDFFAGCNMTIIIDKLEENHKEELRIELKHMFDINVTYSSKEFQEKQEKNEKVFSGIYEGRTKFYKNTIRSGQSFSYNGNVVIIGDVNSGAEVVASGNIIVLGVLRGIAHAGSNGNRRAFVAAYILSPLQLRIADIISRAPDERLEKPKMPEIAKIRDNNIIVEPYLPNKYL